MLQTATGLARSRVNPIGPSLAALAGAALAASGHTPLGVGVAAGGLLAYVNGLLLSRRVDLAADTRNVAGALLVVQAGFLVSLTIVAIATVLLARYSATTALGEAGGFGATHIAILGTYYWRHARRIPAGEAEA